jgi:vacuolar-type H+-ATPase subunit I/STV1
MSSASKLTTIRALVPKNKAEEILSSITPFGKPDTREVTITTKGLTIESVVSRIKDYTKLRDEIGQSVRQLGIERDARAASLDPSNLAIGVADAENEMASARSQYQKIVGELEQAERGVQEAEKKLQFVNQFKDAGFSLQEVGSSAGFRRILGRMPAKKLDAALKMVHALLNDRVIITVGAKKKDTLHLLMVTPTDEASRTLQALLPYDFVQMDMPSLNGSNVEEALNEWGQKRNRLTEEKSSLQTELDALRKMMSRPLNASIDRINETLLLLRGSLRLGEGSTGVRIFARLEKPPTPVVVNLLQKNGVLELD